MMKWPNGEVATKEEVDSAYEDGLINDDEYALMISQE